jgi:hypothetical protein
MARGMNLLAGAAFGSIQFTRDSQDRLAQPSPAGNRPGNLFGGAGPIRC